jgi:putative spermidine/putrescine transport system substrate-binding protein
MKKIKTFIVTSAMALSTGAWAQDTLYFAGYSGDFQKTFETIIIPDFEKANDVKVVYVPGSSSENLAKLQAQRANQQIDVALFDDGPMHYAVQFGLCADLQSSPVYDDVYEIAGPSKFQGKAVGVGLVATGLAYNKDTFAKNGWPAPTSWNDIADTKYVKRVVSNPISGTFGLNTLIMFARMNGGNEQNIDPGFNVIREKVAPNLLAWTSSNAQLAQMFQSHDVDLAVWGSNRVEALRKTGFPVGFIYPKEGTPAIIASACAIQKSGGSPKAQALIQYLASPTVQAKFAIEGFGPVNRMAKLDGEVSAELPYGDKKLSQLVPVDWDTVNKKRADWTKQWSRTVE